MNLHNKAEVHHAINAAAVQHKDHGKVQELAQVVDNAILDLQT